MHIISDAIYSTPCLAPFFVGSIIRIGATSFFIITNIGYYFLEHGEHRRNLEILHPATVL